MREIKIIGFSSNEEYHVLGITFDLIVSISCRQDNSDFKLGRRIVILPELENRHGVWR